MPTTCQVAMLPAVACAAPDHRSRGAASASRLRSEAQPLRTSPKYEIDGFPTMMVIPIMMVLNDVWLPYDGYSLLFNNDAFQWVIQ